MRKATTRRWSRLLSKRCASQSLSIGHILPLGFSLEMTDLTPLYTRTGQDLCLGGGHLRRGQGKRLVKPTHGMRSAAGFSNVSGAARRPRVRPVFSLPHEHGDPVSSAEVSCFSAKSVGHLLPSSRLALSL